MRIPPAFQTIARQKTLDWTIHKVNGENTAILRKKQWREQWIE